MTYQQSHAPEIYGDYWFNSEPLSIRALLGRPALIFFCDQTSLQSQSLIPLINGLHGLYVEYGLTCIGIHSPQFSFNTSPDRVENWIKKNLILFPILTDNERLISSAYRISSIPAICMIDNKGDVYDTIDANFVPEKIERSVQYLLRQSGYRGELPILINPAFEKGYLLTADIIQEIHTGYYHGALGNPEGYSPELPAQYSDPKYHVTGKFYAEGIWRAERDAFVYEGTPNEGYIICGIESDETNIIVESTEKGNVKIELDGKPLPIANMGNDVRKNKKGETIVAVDDPRLLSVLKKNNAASHVLKFTPQRAGIRFYMVSSATYSRQDPSEIDTTIRNN